VRYRVLKLSNRYAAFDRWLVLDEPCRSTLKYTATNTDLGYEGLAGPALRMPVKKVKDAQLTEAQQQYNLIVRGVHAIAERANSLLKTTFKALRRVSVCPWRIGAITRAALVLLHLEHRRPMPAHHTA
jgi:DDE superfamily endonuclease